MTFAPVSEALAVLGRLFQGRNWLLMLPALCASMFNVTMMIALWWFLWRDYAPQPFPLDPHILTSFPRSQFYLIWFATTLVMTCINAFAQGWTLTAASPIWEGKNPVLSAGFNRAIKKLPSLIGFYLLLVLAVVLTAITILGPIAVVILSMYGSAYIMFEDKSPFEALRSSYLLATRNIGTSLIAIAAIVLVGVLTYVANWLLTLIPNVPWPMTAVIQVLSPVVVTAYSAVVIYRFYDKLRGRHNSS